MRTKKDIPISILKELQPYVKMNDENFIVVEPEGNFMKAIDKDLKSKFHYTVKHYEIKGREHNLTLIYSPTSEDNVAERELVIKKEQLSQHFEKWINLLRQYDEVKSFYDDPVLETFEAEFIADYDFISDGGTKPLGTKQIIQIDYVLEHISAKLLSMADDGNAEQIEAINIEIEEIRNNLHSQSKKWVVEKIAKVYGKVAKQGVKFIKEFWKEGNKEFMKRAIEGIADFTSDAITGFLGN